MLECSFTEGRGIISALIAEKPCQGVEYWTLRFNPDSHTESVATLMSKLQLISLLNYLFLECFEDYE